MSLGWGVVLMFAVSGSSPANAAPAETETANHETDASTAEERAAERRVEAEALFKKGDFEGALAAFREAHELASDPTDLFNLGLIYEEMGQLRLALEHYEAFVQQGHLSLEELRAGAERIEILRVLVPAAVPSVASSSGETAEPDAAPSKPSERTSPNSDRTSDPDVGMPLIRAGASLLGIGVALGVGGGVAFGLLATRNSERVEQLETGANPRRLSLTEAEDLDAQGRGYEALQITFITSGAVLAIVGTGLLAGGVAKRKRGRLESVSAFATPKTAAFQAQWRF